MIKIGITKTNTMEQKLIKLSEGHYIVVDGSEIKGKGFRIDLQRMSIGVIDDDNYYNQYPEQFKRITHSTKPIENEYKQDENGKMHLFKEFDNIKPLDLSYIKELVGEVDIEKKAASIFPMKNGIPTYLDKWEGYKAGYNQALEDNKEKRFTEDDIRKAFKAGREHVWDDYDKPKFESYENYVNSLQKEVTSWDVYWDNGQLKLK
jgi:hypothetical protein